MIHCLTNGFGHVWHFASANHLNIGVRGNPEWGTHCTCEMKVEWTGAHNKTDGREEIEKFIWRSRANLANAVMNML